MNNISNQSGEPEHAMGGVESGKNYMPIIRLNKKVKLLLF